MSNSTEVHSRELRLGQITVEYTLGQARLSGRWVAIATIAEEDESDDLMPCRLVVGVGASPEEATADLAQKVEEAVARQVLAVGDLQLQPL